MPRRLAVPGDNRALPGGWRLTARVRRGRPRRLDGGPWRAFFDWPAARGGRWIWRAPRDGDRFRPLGLGGTKTLSDFFCDEKVPAATRGRVPVVARDGRVAWVVGLRMDDGVKVGPSTRETLVLEAVKET